MSQSDRISRLEAENQFLREELHRLREHMEYLEDSLEAHLARADHEWSGARSYSLQEVREELGL